jgi:hypothetical protein
MGDAHLALVERYGALIGELAASLKEDAAMLDPAGRVYSPFGMAYGFVADILSNMALTTLHARTPDGLSLEDMFVSQGALDRKLARAEAWQALPRREGEREHFDHSPEWARQMFGRLMDALAARALRPFQPNVSSVSTARLVVAPGDRALLCLRSEPRAGHRGHRQLGPRDGHAPQRGKISRQLRDRRGLVRDPEGHPDRDHRSGSRRTHRPCPACGH